jgi:GntR family transcriptional regulator/MocR family aminotransferase
MTNSSDQSAIPLSRQSNVFDRLRQGILTGTLQPGARLPPTRHLADELGMARQTVVLAYERLAEEGYVRTRIGSGTFVAADLPDVAPAPAAPSATAARALSRRGSALAATPISAGGATQTSTLLAPGVPAPELFPAAAWATCTARVLRQHPPEGGGYPYPQGLLDLRIEIAAHLAASRGLLADPEHILVTSGTQQALRLAADLLLDPGDHVWVEDPGYIAGRGALLAAGCVPVPVRSDADGLDVAAGIAAAPALPIGRRLALLDWATQAGAWLLEDDCDSEFRWEGRPLPPLATLDRDGRVIYCGTFSKTLSPALRLGFAVIPAPLVPAFRHARALMDRGPATPAQAVLAEFMRQGRLAPHIRRMRTDYARRRGALLAALAVHCAVLEPLPAPGGLHLVAMLPAGADEARVVAAARARGLGVAPLGAYFASPPSRPGLVMGFAATPIPLAADAARKLHRAIASVHP